MTITEQDLAKTRLDWGNGLIEISNAYEANGIDDARPVASRILDQLYGFYLGPVLFKPTLSGGVKTFRTSKDGALSYFVGHDANYPDDGGFGIKYWREVWSETAASFVNDNTAMWMGWVMFKDRDGNVIKVDKSFGYQKDAAGALKIVLHHSSLPFEG